MSVVFDDAGEGPDDVGTSASPVRAYVRTGGRTRSLVTMRIETLVSVTKRGLATRSGLTHDYVEVLQLCHQARSVAEVAALVPVPIGVAKVLLGDLADQGLITVHSDGWSGDRGPDQRLMERVIEGLRKLDAPVAGR
ncbi:MAG: DUF742 domain-containing protein [Kutzneria sp.]|nr:DUF742 domain-containing protein [Kutzneria sp.]